MPADRVRDEAERLVAAALAAVSSATRGLGTPGTAAGDARAGGERSGFATGSAECCVCPVCRAISAMRDPSSDLADRLATGVGDLANGVAAILRAFSTRGARDETPEDGPATAEGDEFWEELRRKAADAAKAYARPSTGGPSTEDDPWRAATREPSGGADEAATVPETLIPKPTVARKTTARKAVPKPAAEPAARPRVAKKAVAKKAVKNAAQRDGEA